MFVNRPRSHSFNHETETRKTVGQDTTSDGKEAKNSSSPWRDAKSRIRPRNSPDSNNAKPQKQTKINNYWLSQPIPTLNSFEATVMENNKETESTIREKLPQSPPIFVDIIENIEPLKQLLDAVASNNYELKVLRDNGVTILINMHKDYKEDEKQLDIKGTDYYTYKPKEERSFSAVLKNMHPSTNLEDIKKGLLKFGQVTVNISNIKQRITKKPLHMFIVELAPQQNNKQIYDA
ncbi:hypothetical protein EVAR_45067_1 [Eumeta japonica]|uniref:Pre-C2HC domain-containing protein n=1 Tax=Eumeta variegata TaxID=151549 RepID=A0A4C1XVW5_EUMVA|nr:hypothetical protein EVAR_45067_1 [Eumeta japonica]